MFYLTIGDILFLLLFIPLSEGWARICRRAPHPTIGIVEFAILVPPRKGGMYDKLLFGWKPN